MGEIKSKLTAQNQISVPADVRKMLGIGPGSTVEWVVEDGRLIVRRAGGYTFDELHKAAFPDGPPSGPPVDVKKAIAEYMRKRHARD